jgi:G3E family GTPase
MIRRPKIPDVARWLNAESNLDESHHGHGHHHQHDINRHSADIGSFTLEFEKALHWEHVANWLDALVMGHGNDLLRVKGILDIASRERPIVVQAVQSLFHPPSESGVAGGRA